MKKVFVIGSCASSISGALPKSLYDVVMLSSHSDLPKTILNRESVYSIRNTHLSQNDYSINDDYSPYSPPKGRTQRSHNNILSLNKKSYS